MKKEQLEELDRLANELTEKVKSYGGTLFLIYGKDREGKNCAGRFEGTTPNIVSNLVTVQVIDPVVRGIIHTSVYSACNMSADENTIILAAEVKQKKN